MKTAFCFQRLVVFGMVAGCLSLACCTDRTASADDDGTASDATAPDGSISDALVEHDGASAAGCALQVTVGTRFACALKRNASVWCWGVNGSGQLGHGSKDNSVAPVQVKTDSGGALDGIVQIVAGCQHACARRSDNTLWCWGRNASGNLGHPGGDQNVAVQVVSSLAGEPLSDVVEVTAGCAYTCAVRSDKTVWCWGLNNTNQLGDGTTLDRDLPVQVLASPGGPGFAGVSTLAAAGFHTCGIGEGGTVWCWGRNDFGQLGDGTGVARPTPVRPKVGGNPLDGVTQIAGGFSHTCARGRDGLVWCWGEMDSFGEGASLSSLSPVRVEASPAGAPFAGVRSLSTHLALHSCAVKEDKTLWCWGENGAGQLGDGTKTWRPHPVQVAGENGHALIGVESVDISQTNTCGALSDGTVWCWGDNTEGQLGTTTIDESPTPIEIPLSCRTVR